jgi:hypothetical protein
MAVTTPSRPALVSLPVGTAPAATEKTAEATSAPQPASAPAGDSTFGDRWALLLWIACALLMSSLLVKDLVGAIVRAVFEW